MAEEKKVKYHTGNPQFDAQEDYIAGRIKEYLDGFAATDEFFKGCYENPENDFEEAMIYVTNMAYKDPTQSSDDACYQNARHYYTDKKSLKESEYTKFAFGRQSAPKATEQDSKLLKENEKLKKELAELKKAENKPTEEQKKEQAPIKPKKEKPKATEPEQMSLFDWE